MKDNMEPAVSMSQTQKHMLQGVTQAQKKGLQKKWAHLQQ